MLNSTWKIAIKLLQFALLHKRLYIIYHYLDESSFFFGWNKHTTSSGNTGKGTASQNYIKNVHPVQGGRTITKTFRPQSDKLENNPYYKVFLKLVFNIFFYWGGSYSLCPVSYTHLDVYKRQLLVSHINFLL